MIAVVECIEMEIFSINGKQGFCEVGFGETGFGGVGYGETGFGEVGFGETGFGEAGFGEAGGCHFNGPCLTPSITQNEIPSSILLHRRPGP